MRVFLRARSRAYSRNRGYRRRSAVNSRWRGPVNRYKKQEAIPYTFEDSLALTNLELFRGYEEPKGLLKQLKGALGRDTLEDASKEMLACLEKGSKAEMALELLYLTEPGQVEPPAYISDGLKWLEGALATRKVDYSPNGLEEVNDA